MRFPTATHSRPFLSRRAQSSAFLTSVRPKQRLEAPVEFKKFRKEAPMKSFRNRMLVIASFALAAVGASAIPAPAQDVCKGSFTLPHEVRLHNATLPASASPLYMNTHHTPPPHPPIPTHCRP